MYSSLPLSRHPHQVFTILAVSNTFLAQDQGDPLASVRPAVALTVHKGGVLPGNVEGGAIVWRYLELGTVE